LELDCHDIAYDFYCVKILTLYLIWVAANLMIIFGSC